MNFVSLALTCGLLACSGAVGHTDKSAATQPSPGLGPTLPNAPAAAAEPVLAAAQPTAAAPEEAAAKASSPAAAVSCTFSALERFEGRTVKWEGECTGGKADGKGVLRAYPKAGSADKAVLIFFGTLERGDAKIGVIETPRPLSTTRMPKVATSIQATFCDSVVTCMPGLSRAP